MKLSSILIASLLQTAAHAAEQNEKLRLRRATETVESHTLEHPPRAHKHKPRATRGEKQSKTVTYFTMGGKNSDDSDSDKDARIVGGSQSSAGEFPYYVDLNGCGGSLIAPNVVLTAAHCGSFQGNNIIVGAYRAGSTQNNAVSVSVSGEALHPNYDDFTLANDFQLLRLSQDVTVGGSNVVLSINNQSSSPTNGEDLTVLGLGTTTEEGNTANKLRDVEVQAIDTNTCNQSNSYGGDVEGDTMFCAGVNGGGKDSCQGDSGGPIVKRVGNQHIQVGVVSWGDGCARPNKPGVYARISSAFDWIEQVVCDQWNSDADFCGGTAPTPPSPTPPSPTPSPATPDGGGGGGNGDCPSGQMHFDFKLRTDDYGDETTWEAVRSSGKTVASGSGLDSDKIYRERTCIPDGCYTLTIFDSYGDGLSAGGSNPGYVLKIDGENVEKRGGLDFGSERSIDFGSCSGGDSEGGSGNGSCIPVALNVRTDDYGYETDLFLVTGMGDSVWNTNGFADNKDYQFTTCLDRDKCATLDIFDEWGDGILSPGYIKLTVDGQVAFDSGDIGGGIIFRIGQGC